MTYVTYARDDEGLTASRLARPTLRLVQPERRNELIKNILVGLLAVVVIGLLVFVALWIYVDTVSR